MSYIEKEKLIKADLASIENRVRHAFNQGYDLGYKEGKATIKENIAVDCVDRREVINRIFYSTDNSGDVVLGSALMERIEKLPSVTPHKPTTKEKLVVSNIIDDIEGLTWYRVANGQLTEGANSKTDTPLYKACDIERILEKYRG